MAPHFTFVEEASLSRKVLDRSSSTGAGIYQKKLWDCQESYPADASLRLGQDESFDEAVEVDYDASECVRGPCAGPLHSSDLRAKEFNVPKNSSLLCPVSMRTLRRESIGLETALFKRMSQQRIARSQTLCTSRSMRTWTHSYLSEATHMPLDTKIHANVVLSPNTLCDSQSYSKGAVDSCSSIRSFILSRVQDPTSYFFRFRWDNCRQYLPQKRDIHIVDIEWLKPHEEIVSLSLVSKMKKVAVAWDAFTEPLLVDIKTGCILDGHHRYAVALQLQLKQLPAVLVDYIGEDSITLDVWPGCGRESLTKFEVIGMALSDHLFPPKTSRHRCSDTFPPISVKLEILRQSPTSSHSVAPDLTCDAGMTSQIIDKQSSHPAYVERRPSFREVSMTMLCEAHAWAIQMTKSLFLNRIRRIEGDVIGSDAITCLDKVKRPTIFQAASSSFFDVIRANDTSSSFCRRKASTLEDLLSSDMVQRRKFYTMRICDPTSFFYKYHFDISPLGEPRKSKVQLVKLKWLKEHEHVVSWRRVSGLKKATLKWGAYTEPLLVDRQTGAILDGHHRFHVGVQLQLESVPAVLVDYLNDESITVDVWPNCGRDSLTKKEIIAMALSDNVFPPKTSRHKYSDNLPPVLISLNRLRAPLPSGAVLIDL